MTRFARIDNATSTAMEIITVPPGFTFERMFPADFIARCVQCDENVGYEWIWDGERFSPPRAPDNEE